jgi:hypothetical protein
VWSEPSRCSPSSTRKPRPRLRSAGSWNATRPNGCADWSDLSGGCYLFLCDQISARSCVWDSICSMQSWTFGLISLAGSGAMSSTSGRALASSCAASPRSGTQAWTDRAVHINAKYAEEGEWAKEEQSWLWKLSMAGVGRTEISERSINAHVRLTTRFQELQEDEAGRSYLRAHIDRLAAELAAAKLRLASAPGAFPAVELIEDLIEVTVMGPPESAGGGGTIGVPTDVRREVARVVRGAVARGAAQLPSDEPGLVLLDPGMHAPSHLLVEEVKRWMAAEGAACSNLAGVLVIAEVLVEPVASVVGRLEQIVPVWHDEAPRWVVDGPWDALSDALSARAREALEHRARIAVDGDREDALLAAVG